MNHNETIRYLLDRGTITQEDLDEAAMNTLNDADKDIVDDLHTRFCKLNHDNGECRWYDEEIIRPIGSGVTVKDSVWKLPSHKRWTDLFLAFIRSANLVEFVIEGITEEPTSSPNDSTPSS